MKMKLTQRAAEAEVNMTPMLDIVFIMLIFFIVASTFIREDGLDVTQKQDNTENKAQPKNRAIYVQVCANSQIYIDGRAIDVRSVRANVEAKLAKEPNSVVIVETEQKAPTGSLVMVMDQAIAAKAAVSIAPESGRCVTST